MPKHITFVLENFYPEYRAGTETYVLNLAKGLMKQNWKITVIIAAVGKSSYTYEFDGITVYALSVPEKIQVNELNGLINPSNLNVFKQTLEQIKPDIIHFHSFSRSFTHFHLKVANEFGAKVYFTAHLGGIFCARGDLQLFGKKQCNAQIKTIRCSACYASQRNNLFKSFSGAILASVLPQSPLKNKLPALNLIPNKKHSMHYLAQYTHQCIAIAHWIENAFKINGIEQVTTLTQAIDTSFFTPQLNSPDKNKIQIGFIGRMNPSKGFQLVLDALEKNNLYEKFELHVITIKDKSEPDFYTEMKNRFKDLGYTNWQEQLSHNQINKEMDNWNLLILPSIANEAAPLVILEAFAKGIPGIGSDYPAIAEMIFHNKNGWLFKNGNSIDLYSLLSELNKDRINKAKENIKAPKDIKELVDEHESLYQSYLNN